MSTPDSQRSQEMWELLNRYLSGEASPDERRQAQDYLAAHPDVAQEFRELERARALVRRAVDAEPIPESLHGTVLHATVDADAGSEIDFGLGTIITLPESESGRTRRWYFAAVAAVLLLAAGWFALRQSAEDADGIAGRVTPVDSVPAPDPVVEILRIGMTDHLQCAVAHHKGNIPEEAPETMRAALGEEFAGLMPVVRKSITEGKLMVAHRCTFGGRNYVHLIIKGEGKMISVAITPKERGESFTGRRGVAATASAIPVYRTAMDGFEVAGFETGEFFVFIASDLPEKRNLQVAVDMAVPVSQVIGS